MKDSSKYLAELYMMAIKDKIDKISNGDTMAKQKKLIKFLARELRKDSNGLFAERYRFNALSKEYTNLLYNNKKTMNDIKSIYDIVFNEYECDMSVIDNIDVPKSEVEPVYIHKENHNTKPRRNYRYPKYYNKINT